jgi:hypothetical protein
MRLAPAALAALLAAASLAPALAHAQAYDGYAPAPYADPCAQDRTNRAVAGGLLGAIGGAVIGSNLAHGGSRDAGAVVGGLAGGVSGAAIGHATSSCGSVPQAYPVAQTEPAPYDDQDDGGPYNDQAYGQGYNQGYGAPPPSSPPYGGPYGAPAYGNQPYGSQGYSYQTYSGPPAPAQPYAGGYTSDRCTMVESRVYFPDGTTERGSVRACQDPDGRWRLAQ